MQTKKRDKHGVKHFMIWRPHLKNDPDFCHITMGQVKRNGVTLSTLMESAISLLSGFDVVDQVTCDLSDGSDAKYVSARKHSSRYSAGISGIKNKTGLLRVQVYEPMCDKFYWFCIPYEIYSQYKNDIEIPFLITGDPDRALKNPLNINWWDYEVGSFTEMALTPNTGIVPTVGTTTFSDFFEEEENREKEKIT